MIAGMICFAISALGAGVRVHRGLSKVVEMIVAEGLGHKSGPAHKGYGPV